MAFATFIAGLFAGTNDSDADAVYTIPPAAYHVDVSLLPPPLALAKLPATETTAAIPAITASLPALAPVDPDSRMHEPFGIGKSRLTSGGIAEKWRNVSNSIRVEHRLLDRCRQNAENCMPAAKRFLAVVELGRKAQGRMRIGLINRAINLNIRPASDIDQYGVEDLWATPLMTFASGAGDCEDYAIAKYVALREAGIPESDLRLVVVRDNAVHDYHAVAAVRDDGRWLILDNRTLAIREDNDIAAFSPLFAMGEDGVRRVQAMASKPRPNRNRMKAASADVASVRMADDSGPVRQSQSFGSAGLPLLL